MCCFLTPAVLSGGLPCGSGSGRQLPAPLVFGPAACGGSFLQRRRVRGAGAGADGAGRQSRGGAAAAALRGAGGGAAAAARRGQRAAAGRELPGQGGKKEAAGASGERGAGAEAGDGWQAGYANAAGSSRSTVRYSSHERVTKESFRRLLDLETDDVDLQCRKGFLPFHMSQDSGNA